MVTNEKIGVATVVTCTAITTGMVYRASVLPGKRKTSTAATVNAGIGRVQVVYVFP